MAKAINPQKLHEEYKRNPRETVRDLCGAAESGKLTLRDVSVRDLAEAFLGETVVNGMDPRRKSGRGTLREAADAVDTSAFSTVNGQFIYAEVKKQFELATLVADQLCRTRQSPFRYGERVPGIGGIGDEAETVQEGMPYPTAGLNEEYIDYPAPTKKGMIVPVTRETIVFDRTGVVVEQAGKVGKWLGLNKEKRVLDCVFGVTNTYKRNGTGTNTYLTSGAYINSQGNTLVDWTDIENAELLFDAMTDPNTGEPIGAGMGFGGRVLIVPSALRFTAMRVTRATQVRFGDGASSTTATYSENPLGDMGISGVLSSPYVKARTTSASTWFYGRPKDAFVYNEVWALETDTAPAGNQAQFERDIELQYKASEFGTPGVEEPRYMTRNT